MTTEITGLVTAQRFAAGMAAAHAGAIASVESFRASVTTAGVTGDAVTAADRAAEAQTTAAAAWQRAHTALLEQDPVAEAYAAAPDAGGKEFLTEAGGPAAAASSLISSSPKERQMTAEHPPLPDKLRLAGRILLGPGEQFAGSDLLKDREGTLLLGAAVDTPDGRQVHLGVPIDPDDRKRWRGAHAPAQETEYDEDDDTDYAVDTGADTTVLLDAADAARLGELAEEVISRATAANREYKQVSEDCERLTDERTVLEVKRFGAAGAERKMRLDSEFAQQRKFQQFRRRSMDECASRLCPEDRVRYDALQAQIDAGGVHAWEPGQQERAAAMCGLSAEEYRELRELTKIPFQQRTREQSERVAQLAPYFAPPRSTPLEQQQALICGLTVEELRELQALEKIPARDRYPSQQARIDELDNSPRGATAATPAKTRRMRGRYCSYQNAHHSVKLEYAITRENLVAVEATARPLELADAARLAQVTADLEAANQRFEDLAGAVTASAEIPARNGGALVIEGVQQDENGGVTYKIDRKPADAEEDWTCGDNGGDPYTATAGGLRKVAALLRALAS
jgi:hypothetical protein